MERFIRDQNLELYRQRLADPNTGDAERETIRDLLAEEEGGEICLSPRLPKTSSPDYQRCTDRDTLLRHLLVAEQHMAEGEVQVVRQENLITKMEVDGHDTAKAKTILITLRTTLALHRNERRRLLDALEG